MKHANQIRKTFLDFFEQKGHQIVPSAPIVVKDDPTLMFINAGMNQFKDFFLGTRAPESTRVADTQRCLRVSGKHNDLEEVGHDTYHNTMFEMLGNWSFGDYYKKEAIGWAWELLTEVYGLDKDRMYVTVFEGLDSEGIAEDKEATDFWKEWLPEDRIMGFGKKDNFWEMGETGPCGPCSEIHIDLRSDEDRAKIPGHKLVNMDHPEVVEIWNLVFIEFNRKKGNILEPLPNKHVDTGMGFGRLCMALQNKASVFDTDIFQPYKDFLEQELGCKYGRTEKESIAMRVVMDHIRAITFTIADGQIPSNTGAGYVIRRILRRASRYAFQYFGQKEPFLFRMVALVAENYKEIFPEVAAQQEFIQKIVEEEEKGFLRKLETGTQMFDEYLQANSEGEKTVDGEFAFTLYDTFGFPFDLTEVMAREAGWTVDLKGFEKFMAEQKKRSRDATEVETGDWVQVNSIGEGNLFVGYELEESKAQIVQYRKVKTTKGESFQVVLDQTPFYAESGGQVGDTGTISNGSETLKVRDTQKENDLIVHFTDKAPSDPSGTWTAKVNGSRKRLIKANHSATHLLHAALRQVLGGHVEQRGSMVADNVLRFDFSHFSKMTEDEIVEVEKIVNARIADGIPLDERRNIPIDEAKALGAMALFGEKYGDEVRVIVFDQQYSVELCGGNHVNNTSEIRLFKLISESSIAAGIRRVECLTSNGAFEYLEKRSELLEEISAQMKNPRDPVKALTDILERNKTLEKQLEKLNAAKVGGLMSELKNKAKEVDGIRLLNEVVEVGSANDLKTMCFNLRKSMINTLVVLGAVIDGKPMLNVIMSEDLEKAGRFNATTLVRELAKEIQGGGGGQAFYASAGGKNPDGVPAAVAKVEELLN